MRTMSTQKYETLRRRIVHKQAVLDHSFSEMKCRTDTMAGTHGTLNTDSLTSHLMGGIFFPVPDQGYYQAFPIRTYLKSSGVMSRSWMTPTPNSRLSFVMYPSSPRRAMVLLNWRVRTTFGWQELSSLRVTGLLMPSVCFSAQPFEVESLLESLITHLNLNPSLLGDKDIDITYEIADDVPRYLIGVWAVRSFVHLFIHSTISLALAAGFRELSS